LFRVRLSNDLQLSILDDADAGPPAVRSKVVWALADTGATHSAIDRGVCHELQLIQQGLVPVLFAQATAPEEHPTHPAALAFLRSATDDAAHAWPDEAPFLALDLMGRTFNAVLGMDILRMGDFSIKRRGAVVFEF
jgi:hypothetical protein